MKTFASILIVLLCAEAGSALAAGTAPVLSFDKQGRLVLVVTPDGRRCVYHYAPDGRLVTPADPACGDPQQWIKAKPGG
jgi:YD repeat-containing protein